MLFEHRRPFDNLTPEALHTEVKIWVVVLDNREKISYNDLSVQFFLYLPY